MIPQELKDFLNKYGPTKLLNGYLQLLDHSERDKYSKLSSPITKGYGNLEVFAVTAFVDLLAWDGNYVYMFKLTEGKVEVIMSGFSFFFPNIEDPDFQSEFFDMELFYQSQHRLGNLLEKECLTFEPLPLLGGEKSVESAKKEKTENCIRFLMSMYQD